MPGFPPERQHWQVAASLGLTVAILVLASIRIVGTLKDNVVVLVLHAQPLTRSQVLRGVGLTEALLAAGLVLLGILLVQWEWRRRALSAFLTGAPRLAHLLVITLLLLWLGHAYLFPGVLLGGDSGTHISRFLEVRRGLDQGSLPQWTNYQYLGSSLLGFTGPLTYVVGGALDVVVRDPVVTAKTLLLSLHLVGGWLCYALLRRFGLERFAAAVGALAYAGAFAHLHLFLYRGAFPQAFTICFFLAAFLCADGLMRPGQLRWRDWTGFAFATAGLVVTHQPHAIFVAIYLLVFGCVGCATGHWRWASVGRLATAGALGAAMSAIAVLPVLREAGWVMLEPGGAMFHLQVPSMARLLQLVTWRNTRTTWGTDYWAYLGMVTIGLALCGLAAGLRHPWATQGRLVLAVLPCLALSFFLANPVVRDVMFLLFFVAVLAAIGAEALVTRLAGWPRARLAVMGLLLLDLTSTSVQPVARNDKEFGVAAGRYLERVAPDQRVMEVALDAAGRSVGIVGPVGPVLSYAATVQRIAGNHNMAATHVHNDAETAVTLAARDLREHGTLSAQSRQLLALFNVARIVCDSSVAEGCPATFGPLVADGPLGGVVAIGDASPVLFSRRLSLLAPSDALDKPMFWSEDLVDSNPRFVRVEAFLRAYLDAARPDFRTRQAASLPVAALPPGQADPVGATSWTPRLTGYTVSLETVTATIEADQPGYVQLAHPWFPASIVRVNGVEVTPLQGALHLMVVPIAAGGSQIEITSRTTSIRLVAAAVSAMAVVVTLLVPLLFRRRVAARPPVAA